MNKIAVLSLVALVGAFSARAVFAEELTYEAKKTQAVAQVKKVIAAIKADGAEKVYADINAKDAKYVAGDVYADVYDLDGNNLAHATNAKLIGKNWIELQDPDGKYIIKERVEKAKTQESFWYEYKYTNPVTKKIDPKDAYCERLAATVVCSYAYR